MKRLVLLFSLFLLIQTLAFTQVWSESFENSTDLDDYTRNTGFEFRNTGSGTPDLFIGTTSGGAGLTANPSDGTYALYNRNVVTGAQFEFISSYFYISSGDSVAFHYRNTNSSVNVDYTISLTDTSGNKTTFSSSTLSSNQLQELKHFFTGAGFPGDGWYRVSFEFDVTSGNNNAVYMLDNFRSSISEFAPYLIELDLDCNTYKSFGSAGEPDSMTYETIITNNGPDTVVHNEPVQVIVTLPSTPFMTFEDYSAPEGTTLIVDTDDPNIAVWEISKFNVGQTLTLTSKSSYSDENHGTVVANSSILGGLANIYIDPNSGNDSAYCFIMLLPVTLTNFSAIHNENVVSVNWTTVSEINNQGFEVYSSTDAINWEYLDFVEGVGNSNEVTNYRYYDHSPLSQTRFYKLIQVDFDGKTEEFGPVKINIDNHLIDKNISIFPNPSNGVVKVEFISHTVSSITNTDVNVYSITGQVVHQAALDFNTSNLQSLDLSHLPKGQYILKLSNNEHVYTTKIVLE